MSAMPAQNQNTPPTTPVDSRFITPYFLTGYNCRPKDMQAFLLSRHLPKLHSAHVRGFFSVYVGGQWNLLMPDKDRGSTQAGMLYFPKDIKEQDMLEFVFRTHNFNMPVHMHIADTEGPETTLVPCRVPIFLEGVESFSQYLGKRLVSTQALKTRALEWVAQHEVKDKAVKSQVTQEIKWFSGMYDWLVHVEEGMTDAERQQKGKWWDWDEKKTWDQIKEK